MGMGIKLKCPKCGKETSVYTGVGKLFMIETKELKKLAENGGLGEETRKIFSENANCTIDIRKSIYVCECGHWEHERRNDIYNVDSDKKVNVLKAAEHRCPKCGRLMSSRGNDISELHCNDCGTLLERKENFLWD